MALERGADPETQGHQGVPLPRQVSQIHHREARADERGAVAGGAGGGKAGGGGQGRGAMRRRGGVHWDTMGRVSAFSRQEC